MSCRTAPHVCLHRKRITGRLLPEQVYLGLFIQSKALKPVGTIISDDFAVWLVYNGSGYSLSKQWKMHSLNWLYLDFVQTVIKHYFYKYF